MRAETENPRLPEIYSFATPIELEMAIVTNKTLISMVAKLVVTYHYRSTG